MNFIENFIQGSLLVREPLAHYTTWRVGGAAKHMYKPLNIPDLSAFLKQIPADEPLFWLGLGSNLLIRDTGFSGTVLLMQGCLDDLSLVEPDCVRVEAGVSCAKMARFCARNGLVGGEFWAGIPGTMGGALRMNAGCFDGSTWQWVERVETMTKTGEIRQRSSNEFKISYRYVEGLEDGEGFIAAFCRLEPGDKTVSFGKIKRFLEHRKQTQPTDEYNCGSVFRNPPNHFAAQLIESCNLKGRRIGGAVVSPKHANFIVNDDGKALAQDIESLIQEVQKTVYAQTQVFLMREVHILGD